jgi:hypothetical protein
MCYILIYIICNIFIYYFYICYYLYIIQINRYMSRSYET